MLETIPQIQEMQRITNKINIQKPKQNKITTTKIYTSKYYWTTENQTEKFLKRATGKIKTKNFNYRGKLQESYSASQKIALVKREWGKIF